MTPDDRWNDWAADWRSAPSPDLVLLRDEAMRKRRRIRITVALELAATTISLVVVLPQLLKYWDDVVIRIELILALLLIAGVQWLTLHARRNTWQAVADVPSEWLRLSIRRARAALRLVYIQIVGAILAVALLVPLLWHMWSQTDDVDVHRHLILVVAINAAVNAAILLPALGWAIWYAAQQRRKMRKAEAMLRELGE